MQGVYIDRTHFKSRDDAARHYQHAAYLRAAGAREVARFGPMRCAQMQREAAAFAATARSLLA